MISKSEIIARTYYLLTVEIGEPFEVSDLGTVLDCNLGMDDFYRWLKEQELETEFEQWLELNDLEVLFHSH